MAQLKCLTLSVEVEVPVSISTQKNLDKRLEAVVTTDMRKPTRFLNKLAKLCRRYGYSAVLEGKKDEL